MSCNISRSTLASKSLNGSSFTTFSSIGVGRGGVLYNRVEKGRSGGCAGVKKAEESVKQQHAASSAVRYATLRFILR